jgi:hypothetical protein
MSNEEKDAGKNCGKEIQNTGNKFRQGGDSMVKFSHFILDMQ